MRPGFWLGFVAALACSGCPTSSDEPVTPIVHEDRMRAWVEFADAETLDEHLDFAEQHDLSLNVALIEGTHDWVYLRNLCRGAEERELALRLWPLLSDEEGYWANQQNADAFSEYVRVLAAWAGQDCPRLEGVVIDLEMPLDRALEMEGIFAGEGGVTDLVEFLVDGVDEAAFEAARVQYSTLVDDLHDKGLHVSASTLPMVLDDLEDGDESIAHALWTPLRGIDWDVVSFQVYRSTFDSIFSAGLSDPEATFTSGLITSYADSAVIFYGDKAAIDLGTTGSGVGTEVGLDGPDELQADMAAALYAGIPQEQIHIYSLEGIMADDNPSAWLIDPLPHHAEVDEATEEWRALMATLDAIER
jgi:hypothetical protein